MLQLGDTARKVVESLIHQGMTLENQLDTFWNLLVSHRCIGVFPRGDALLRMVKASGVPEARTRQMIKDFFDKNAPSLASIPSLGIKDDFKLRWAWMSHMNLLFRLGRGDHLRALGLGESGVDILTRFLVHGVTIENQLYSFWRLYELTGSILYFPNDAELQKILMEQGIDQQRVDQMITEFRKDPHSPPMEIALSPKWFGYDWKQNLSYAWTPLLYKIRHRHPLRASSSDIAMKMMDYIVGRFDVTLENQLEWFWKIFKSCRSEDDWPDDEYLLKIVIASGVEEDEARRLIDDFKAQH